jgi:hypothetical protein
VLGITVGLSADLSVAAITDRSDSVDVTDRSLTTVRG